MKNILYDYLLKNFLKSFIMIVFFKFGPFMSKKNVKQANKQANQSRQKPSNQQT